MYNVVSSYNVLYGKPPPDEECYAELHILRKKTLNNRNSTFVTTDTSGGGVYIGYQCLLRDHNK